MAQEFVVLFKKLHLALPLPGRRQLKAQFPFLTSEGNTPLLKACFVLWIVGSVFVVADMPARFSQLCCTCQPLLRCLLGKCLSAERFLVSEIILVFLISPIEPLLLGFKTATYLVT